MSWKLRPLSLLYRGSCLVVELDTLSDQPQRLAPACASCDPALCGGRRKLAGSGTAALSVARCLLASNERLAHLRTLR